MIESCSSLFFFNLVFAAVRERNDGGKKQPQGEWNPHVQQLCMTSCVKTHKPFAFYKFSFHTVRF